MSRDQLPPFVLRDGETFAMLDRRGEINPLTHPDSGIFHRGTRHVSRLELLLWERPPTVLSATERGAIGLHVSHLSNENAGGTAPSRGSVHLERSTLVRGDACLQQLSFTSYEALPLRIPLTLLLEADFHDIFEVRGLQRRRRGELSRHASAEGLCLDYLGLDGSLRRTQLRLGTQPQEWGERHLSLALELEPRVTRRLCLVLSFRSGAAPLPEASGPPEALFDAALAATIARFAAARRQAASLQSDNPALNAWIDRSLSDVHLLSSRLEHGLYPYAGVPWFSCPFGRDGLITARQLLLVEPRLARGVLGFLAGEQARSSDPASDAEPGKILHEARLGEMAALGEVPFRRYYGTVDATPLFVMLAGDYLERCDEAAFIAGLMPALEAATAWIRAGLEGSIDGFLRYRASERGGLRNQGWKDSDDAVHHRDGRLAEGSIALCEVQAYAFGALRAMARILRRWQRHGEAERLLEESEGLRQRFQRAFWSESIGTYALALDGEGRACAVRSSNAGHCLLTGICPAGLVDEVAAQLFAPTSYSGWGIRTLDERESRFNPMSYHNGSVWPHDNALIGLGLARHGRTGAAMRIFSGLFDTARAMPMQRLPELICGFGRRDDEGPTLYPVACSPQAWASGSVFALIEAMTGLAIRREGATERVQVRFRNPLLPPSVGRLEIRGLRLGEDWVDLELRRHEEEVGVLVLGRSAGVDALILK